MKIIFPLLILFLVPNLLFPQVGSWHQTLNGRNVWSLAKDAQGNIYAGGLTGANSRIWKSSTGGDAWDTIYTGAGQTMWDFGFDTLGSIYVANFSNGLLKSTNNGANFSVIPLSQFNNKNLQGVECGNAGYVYVTSSAGFFRSTDFGATFNETALTGLNCLPVIVDKDSFNIVYIGVSSATGTGIGFYRSTDYGLTFSNNLNPGKNGYNLFQKNNGDLFMITTTSPYNFDKSTNKGLTWVTQGNLPQAQRGITTGSAALGYIIYTTGNGGAFRSTNQGLTFENINFTFSATPALYVFHFNTFMIFVGTTGSVNGGVWKYHENYILGVSEGNENSSGFYLFQNYPNPFNPSTRISYSISKSKFITLKIFDVLGNEVSLLVNEKQSPGSYLYKWNATNYPSGIYYYKLIAGDFSTTRKMLFAK